MTEYPNIVMDCYLQETYKDWTSGLGHDVCKPLQLGRWMMDCVTLLIRWRDIRSQVEDQLPQEFQEHVTLTQGPTKPQFTSRKQNSNL